MYFYNRLAWCVNMVHYVIRDYLCDFFCLLFFIVKIPFLWVKMKRNHCSLKDYFVEEYKRNRNDGAPTSKFSYNKLFFLFDIPTLYILLFIYSYLIPGFHPFVVWGLTILSVFFCGV